ncbi:uncharacterized protein RCC_08551 [Ramularia collo-cygni]|uniref:F-box domain-containing protein n=1 Tax=Ramularia collo-cygni TaxID=112498 RepID=A0A2D3VB17_9PEZI|nr:uncharacterized protein RCC_08551 [Ramularia collo-cygni]CZT22845.1 uncharacterized protein RCC_08551 [Ramularia collo-cygni]
MALNSAPHPGGWSTKLVSKIGNTFRSEKAYTQESIDKKKNKKSKLKKKKNPQQFQPPAPEVNELGEQEYAVFAENRRPARPKVQDNGEMMHSLARSGSFDSLVEEEKQDPFSTTTNRKRRGYIVSSSVHQERIASLPSSVWKRIALFLTPLEVCNLALASKTLHDKLGPRPFDILNLAPNKHHKIAFLHQFDPLLPNHLLCFPCAQYHLRLSPGNEVLKKDYVSNPLFTCPKVKTSTLPRTRLTHARELPYAFIQLTLRAASLGPQYGITPETLARKWKCKDSSWQHTTRYLIHDSRLLLRVVSQRFAPPASSLSVTSERHILYDREEYIPFFSVCAHWRDGDLMKICKCMLGHIPSPPDPYHKQLQRGFHVSRAAANPDFIVRGCDSCRPARRCPECPSEYLVEVRLVEDPGDKITRFKHAIVVTRWTDLGDGRNPYTSPEWVAINGGSTTTTSEGGREGEGFDSFSQVGRRAVGGIFESRVSGSTPGQRLLSLNPGNKKMGEDGTGWY